MAIRRQEKVALAEKIAASDIGQRSRQAGVEEGKRLLYVAMTRARDLLVIARPAKKPAGEWIDSLDADWLLPEQGATALNLPRAATCRDVLGTRCGDVAGAQDGRRASRQPTATYRRKFAVIANNSTSTRRLLLPAKRMSSSRLRWASAC